MVIIIIIIISGVGDSSVATLTGLNGPGFIPSRTKGFSLLHIVQTGSVTHPMGTGGSCS
jgi:hypothetical protein